MAVTFWIPAVTFEWPPSDRCESPETVKEPIKPKRDAGASFIPAVTFEWPAPAPEVQAPAPPSTEELETGLRALERGRQWCRKMFKRLKGLTTERSWFDQEVRQILSKRWTKPRGRKGRKPKQMRKEIVKRLVELRADGVVWKDIRRIVNDEFGALYKATSLQDMYKERVAICGVK